LCLAFFLLADDLVCCVGGGGACLGLMVFFSFSDCRLVSLLSYGVPIGVV